MNTIRTTTALFISMGISIVGFSQVNLGLQSTTSAAIHATANTAAILQTTHAASAATNSTVKATSTQVKSTTQKTTGTVQTTENNTKSKVDATTSTNASVSSQSNVTAANSSAPTDINNGISADLKTGRSTGGVKITDSQITTHLQDKTKSAPAVSTNSRTESKATIVK